MKGRQQFASPERPRKSQIEWKRILAPPWHDGAGGWLWRPTKRNAQVAQALGIPAVSGRDGV